MFRTALREGVPAAAALAGAGLFALHPTHVESVAWICGRTDVLCAVLVLASFLCHRRAREAQRWLPYRCASLALFGAALFAKEMAATLPLLLLVEVWVVPDRSSQRLRRAVATAAPYFAVLAGYMILRSHLLPASQPLVQLDLAARAATTIFAAARYLTMLVLPLGLDAHYPYAPLATLFRPVVSVAAAMLLLVVFSAIALCKRSPHAAFWIFWTLASLAPVLLFGRFGDVILADRFLYLPSIGFAVLAARGLAATIAICPARRRVLVGSAAALILAALGLLARDRARIWRNDLTLFSNMLRTSPDSALVHANLGIALYDRERLDEAVASFRRAITLQPSYAMAHNNLAAALERQGYLAAAAAHYSTALDLAPGLLHAERNLGHLLVRLGREREGLARLDQLARKRPDSAEVLVAAADAAQLAGDTRRALDYLDRARMANPNYAATHYLLGKIRYETGQPAEASESMRRFLALAPPEDEHADAARRVIAQADATLVGSPGREAPGPSSR